MPIKVEKIEKQEQFLVQKWKNTSSIGRLRDVERRSKKNWIIVIFLIFTATYPYLGANKNEQTPPVVLTLPAVNIHPWGNYATLRGLLLSKGFTPTCDVWFVWDTSFHFFYPSYAYSTEHIRMREIGEFRQNIYGLKRGVKYHFRAVAYNGYFYDQGVDLVFIPGLPSVSTGDATNITDHSATLHGRLDDNGDVECDVWFVYGTSSNQYIYSTPHIKMNSVGSFSQQIDNLKPSTTYYFCAVASNDAGIVYGVEKNFTTLIATNNPPFPPDKPSGRIWGKPNTPYNYSTFAVDPDGNRIRYYFDWGDGNGEWSEWKESGEIVILSHSWSRDGVYEIRVKAQDEYGLESEWSPSLNVTIESVPPYVTIYKPRNALYIFDVKIMSLLFSTIVIGKITIEVEAADNISGISHVEFYIDGIEKCNLSEEPYQYLWEEITFFRHEIKVVAYDRAGNMGEDKIKVKKFL